MCMAPWLWVTTTFMISPTLVHALARFTVHVCCANVRVRWMYIVYDAVILIFDVRIRV